MTIEEVAEHLNGLDVCIARGYTPPPGIIVAHMYSDDIIYLTGDINDEAYSASKLTRTKVAVSTCEEGDYCPYFIAATKDFPVIDYNFNHENLFFEIFIEGNVRACDFVVEEEGEPYYKGLVFYSKDLPE